MILEAFSDLSCSVVLFYDSKLPSCRAVTNNAKVSLKILRWHISIKLCKKVFYFDYKNFTQKITLKLCN